MTRAMRILLGMALGLATLPVARGQIDPTKRELIQFGYNQPLQGHAPFSGYAFYYMNLPQFLRTNYTLRFALAPVYLDSELGISEALGRNTDVGIGLHGGGFADSYPEIRRGKYLKDESFTGHGGGVSASLYQRLNPGRMIPLYAVLRGEFHYSAYSRDDDTAETFTLPNDRGNYTVRGGLRWGGQEPLMQPDFAMELSVWYEAQFRGESGRYGFNGDRRVEPVSHLFWARALAAYTLPEWKHNLALSLTAGTSARSDRFSAYRLGGVLPLAAEFPLSLPGYYFQEISASRFTLLGMTYSLPLDAKNRWYLHTLATTAAVDYADGLSQAGSWHSGVGGGIRFRSTKDTWQLMLGYAYGVDALRSGGRGAHSIGFLLQFDLERAGLPLFEPGLYPVRSRGLQRLLRLE